MPEPAEPQTTTQALAALDRVAQDVHRHYDPDIATIREALTGAGQRDARVAELETWKRRAEMLWDLLDNIDTAEDMTKGDYEWFFRVAHKQHQKRFVLAGSDGYALEWKPLEAALETHAPTTGLPPNAAMHTDECRYWPVKDAWECSPNCPTMGSGEAQ